MEHPSWERKIHNPKSLAALADQIGKWCKENDVDALAVCGVSGLVPASVVSAIYGINLIAVRKEKDNTHGYKVQGPEYVGRWIILDDLIESGKTMDYILATMREYEPSLPPPFAILLYHEWCSRTEWQGIPITVIGGTT